MLANTKKQNLYKHSLAVCEVSRCILHKLSKSIANDENTHEINENVLVLAALFHDFGKIDDQFQKYVSNPKKMDESNGVHISPDLNSELNNANKEKKFKFSEYIRHNELSYILFKAIFAKDKIKNFISNTANFENIAYLIYWHHAKIARKEEDNILKNLINKAYNLNLNLFSNALKFIDEVNREYNNYNNISLNLTDFIVSNLDNNDFKSNLEDLKDTPEFKKSYSLDQIELEKFKEEARRNLMRSIIVTADRAVSSLSSDTLELHIKEKTLDAFTDSFLELEMSVNNDLTTAISNMEESFKNKNLQINSIENQQRDEEQEKIAKELSLKQKVAVLSGPAGCGKTKIFLSWVKERNVILTNQDSQSNEFKPNKVFIIAPRNLVCAGLYEEIKSEEYLNKSKIEINTGEFKFFYDGQTEQTEFDNYSGDIIITTIDQIIAMMLSHNKIDLMLKLLNSYVIFDEYHEYFNIPGVIYLFKEVIEMKKMLTNSNTLLVSATANPFLLKFLEINEYTSLVRMNSFNNCEYKITFVDYEEKKKEDGFDTNNQMFYKTNETESGAIYVYNTATASQIASLNAIKNYNEKTINYHSKFTPNDKKELLTKIRKVFGKNNSNTENNTLRSGPIVQASLNITTNKMYTEICSAESFCQRFGRLNRFANKEYEVSELIVVNPKNLNLSSGLGKFLNNVSQYHQTIKWINYLISKIDINKTITINDLYNLYYEFHIDENQKDYESDFNSIKKKSTKLFKDNNYEPIQWIEKNKTKSKSGILSATSIRGDSYYVYPMKKIYKMENSLIKEIFAGPLFELKESIDDIDTKEMLTVESNVIDMNPVEFLELNKKMASHNKGSSHYKKFNNKRTDPAMAKKSARNPLTPMVVSLNNDTDNADHLYYYNINNIKIGLLKTSNFKLIIKN